MKTRLNITVEASLVDKIKKYAAKKHVSVSDLTENFYSNLVTTETKPESIFDFLKKVKPSCNYSRDFDFKKNYRPQFDNPLHISKNDISHFIYKIGQFLLSTYFKK